MVNLVLQCGHVVLANVGLLKKQKGNIYFYCHMCGKIVKVKEIKD